LENGAVLRVDIDYAGITKAELRRQRSSYERNVVREAGLQYLAKTRNTFRDQNVIDAVLQICMFAADMKLAKRILCDTRKTQHRLIKRRVFALRLRIESVGADGVTGGTETRDDLFTRDVHLLTLDDDFFSRGSAGRGRGRGD